MRLKRPRKRPSPMQSCQRLLSHRVWWAALVARGRGVGPGGCARAGVWVWLSLLLFGAEARLRLRWLERWARVRLERLAQTSKPGRAHYGGALCLGCWCCGCRLLTSSVAGRHPGGARCCWWGRSRSTCWSSCVLLVGSGSRSRSWRRLAVYLPDISPYVGRADTFEFQVIGPQLGIAHPSGYPLYTLICKAFSLLPVGTVAWRVNLTSAVFAAAASGVMALVMPKRWPHLGLLTGWLLAFSPTLWSRAIEAEVYALNALIVVTGLWLVTAWTDGRLGAGRAWPALGLMMGLALASHVTLGALGAVALGGLAAAEDKPKRNRWLLAVGLGALGMLLYAYIPLRWPAVTGGEQMSLVEFLQYVTNAGSGGALRPLAFVRDPGRWRVVGRLILEQVGWVGLALAGVGWGSLVRQRRWVALGTLVSFGAWVCPI